MTIENKNCEQTGRKKNLSKIALIVGRFQKDQSWLLMNGFVELKRD